MLTRMLPPARMALRQVSQQEGIAAATLHKWRSQARGKGQLLPDAAAGPEGWSSRDTFAAVLERALARKEGALTETAALLVLGKKASAIQGGDEDAGSAPHIAKPPLF